MGMMNRLAGAFGFEKRSDASPTDISWQAVAGGYSNWGDHAVENLSAVLACSNVIATSLGSIPALTYRREGDQRIEALNHPLRRICRSGVNDRMAWPDFIEHLIVSTLLTGNGVAEILRSSNGALSGFRFVPWGSVTVLQLRSGRLAYDINDGVLPTRRLLQDEVVHLRDRTDDGIIGRSRLNRATATVKGIQAANRFAGSVLENGGQPSGAIKSPAELSPEQLSKLRTQFEEKYTGAQNAGRTMILDGGLEFTPFQISPEDAELLATRKFGVEEICRLFQVPPPLVQDYSNNTFTNSETAGRWFAMFTLAPWARKLEAEFARSVFSSTGSYELELDLSGFLRGDPATRWNAHKIAIETKVLYPEEIRQLEGWNPRAPQSEGVD